MTGDFHDRVRSYSMRARLLRANGHFENHVMIAAAMARMPKSRGVTSLATAIVDAKVATVDTPCAL